jgi:nitroreductase
MNINELIKSRRSIFPKTYILNKEISRENIEQILENANWAPTHRLTEPWRFKVFHTYQSRERLSYYLSDHYKNNTPESSFSSEKFKKQKENALRSACAIAIIMQRDSEERVAEFEEIASVAMAVQNMWLTCTELGLGCYWSTPAAALVADEFLKLKEGERCLGFFYMGWHDMPKIEGKRKSIEDKVEWM